MIQQKFILDCQDPDLPKKVHDQIVGCGGLIEDYELQNNSYFEWDSEECGDVYPDINKYLKLKNITDCIILIWW